jgi:hypothetical protein
MYSNINHGHYLQNINSAKKIITLDDESEWQIYDGYLELISSWKPDHMIRVKENKDPEFPYKIINIHTNESVEARLLQD